MEEMLDEEIIFKSYLDELLGHQIHIKEEMEAGNFDVAKKLLEDMIQRTERNINS